jgi:hypothetical protein
MSLTGDTLTALLPAIHRLRDDAQGRPLAALLGLMATQGRLVEEDIAQLLEDWFIETCDEWVVPYIGELLGVTGLRDLGPDAPYTRRALVANAIRYRRRKGTVPVVEQLVRDSAGWPASASEAFLQLGWTQHLNHVRARHGAQPAGGLADLRDPVALQLVGAGTCRTWRCGPGGCRATACCAPHRAPGRCRPASGSIRRGATCRCSTRRSAPTTARGASPSAMCRRRCAGCRCTWNSRRGGWPR